MAHNIPPDFKSLVDARESPDHSFNNIIGIVVDMMPPAVSRKGEHMLTFTLLDLKLADAPGGREGFKIRFFCQDETQLPKVKSIGDAVCLRDIKTMLVQGQRLGLSHFRTKHVVVPNKSIPTPAFSIAYHDRTRIEALGTPLAVKDFDLRQQEYAIALRHSAGMATIIEDRHARMLSNPIPTGPASMRAPPLALPTKQKFVEEPTSAAQPPAKRPKQSSSSLGAKFKLVEELRPNMYADLCGEVVKMYPANWGCDLYITDYTSNDQMRYYPKPEEETDQERDGDTYGYTGPPKKGWPGPYEWLVLKVNLKEPHASYAYQNVKEGDCVLLLNVKGNPSRDGNSRLEADLWADWNDSEKIKIRKVSSANTPEVQALQQRKEKYWASRRHAQPPQIEEEDVPESKASKKAAKKRKKKEREEAAKLALEKEAAELEKKNVNRNMRCTHEDIPVTKVMRILDPQNSMHSNSAPDGREYQLPFINIKYRARVRVVDFEPKDLEDFAVRPEHEYDSDNDNLAWLDNTPASHEWHFALLLEDASIPKSAPETERQRIWVEVHHGSAQFLFGNSLPDPDDLGDNGKLLKQLREKLFLLWGNLEEKTEDEALSNQPFDCVIMEYGVPLEDDDPEQDATSKGWRRMYAMEGASIL